MINMQNLRTTLTRVGNLGNFSISMPNLARDSEKPEEDVGPAEISLQVPQQQGAISCQSSVQGKKKSILMENWSCPNSKMLLDVWPIYKVRKYFFGDITG